MSKASPAFRALATTASTALRSAIVAISTSARSWAITCCSTHVAEPERSEWSASTTGHAPRATASLASVTPWGTGCTVAVFSSPARRRPARFATPSGAVRASSGLPLVIAWTVTDIAHRVREVVGRDAFELGEHAAEKVLVGLRRDPARAGPGLGPERRLDADELDAGMLARQFHEAAHVRPRLPDEQGLASGRRAVIDEVVERGVVGQKRHRLMDEVQHRDADRIRQVASSGRGRRLGGFGLAPLVSSGRGSRGRRRRAPDATPPRSARFIPARSRD